ncbi:MAG: efflux RND transporter periplasmic adaptor subunit [Bacteroidota bacterium]|nr:efflux RND transporter periplasmic adaptor subunit [Bacteroidota bacterium]
MKKKHYIAIAGVVLVIILGVISMKGLSIMKPEPKTVENKKHKTHVKVTPVKYKNQKSETVATGRISTRHFINLSAEVQGKILPGNVPLKKGQSFRKGQLLVRIFNTEAAYALKARKSRFLNSVANLLPDFKIDYPESYQNWLTFFDKTDIDKNIPDLPEIKSSQEKIYLTGRNILSDYYSIKSEQVRMQKYFIYAPFSGSFSDVYIEVGGIANPGGKIAKLIRTNRLELEASVKTSDARFIRKGNHVKVTTDHGKKEYKGTVNRVSDFVDPQTQSVTIFISLTSPKGEKIYQGEYMQATFSNIEVKNAMLLDRDAVINHNEVFIVEKGRLLKQKINILKTNEKTLLFNGLPEDTKLVSEALVDPKENTEVSILNE